MRTKLLSTAVLLFAAGAICGCQKVETDYNPATDFRAFKTFAWDANQDTAESATDRDYPNLLADIQERVGETMVKRGYKQAPRQQADLLLHVHLELAAYEVDQAEDAPETKLGPLVLAPYSVTQVDDMEADRELQEGTVMLTMTDRAGSKPVWQGWVRRVVDVSSFRHGEWDKEPAADDIRYRQRIAHRAVDKLLQDFPPKQAFPRPAGDPAP